MTMLFRLPLVSKPFPVLIPRRTSDRVMASSVTKTGITYKKLGASDLRVSEVCLGCMNFGSKVSEDAAHSILDAALEKGINFFDTSEMYPVPIDAKWQGRCSEILGSWIKKNGVKREDIVIATKLAGYAPAAQRGTFVSKRTIPPSAEADARIDASNIRAATEGELRRLGVDYIDLMQFHWPDRYVPGFGYVTYDLANERDSIPFEEQVQGIADMIEEGKVRYWGLSNESSYGTTMMCVTADKLGCPRPITIQNSFSLVHRSFETELAEVCSERHFNIPLLPWSPAAFGVLTGKYLGGVIPEGSRYAFPGHDPKTSRFFTDRMQKAVEKYVEIAKKFNVSPVQLAYMFCKSRAFVGSTIIGVSTLAQLDENVEAFLKDLPDAALKEINAVHQSMPNPQNIYS